MLEREMPTTRLALKQTTVKQRKLYQYALNNKWH